MTGGQADRLTVHRNPLRMFLSLGPWAATAYLASYLVVGTAVFAVCVAAVSVSLVAGLLTIGVPLLVGSALVVRGCAQVERLRARLVMPQIGVAYLPVTEAGVLAQVRTRWTDPATLRDTFYLVVLYLPLLALDVVVLVIWLGLLAGITLPVWYWSVRNGANGDGIRIGYFANGPHGTFGVSVGSLPAALVVAVACAILALCWGYLVVAGARLHTVVAGRLLGPYRDPLAPAKLILAAPGPLRG